MTPEDRPLEEIDWFPKQYIEALNRCRIRTIYEFWDRYVAGIWEHGMVSMEFILDVREGELDPLVDRVIEYLGPEGRRNFRPFGGGSRLNGKQKIIMIDQPKTLRERFIDHAASAGFSRGIIEESLTLKEMEDGGLRPYHHEIVNSGRNDGHYAYVNKDENSVMVGVVSTEKGIETVYRWEAPKPIADADLSDGGSS